jgi:hypothetical protein
MRALFAARWQQQRSGGLVFMTATEQRIVGERWAQVLTDRQIDRSEWIPGARWQLLADAIERLLAWLIRLAAARCIPVSDRRGRRA